MYKQYIFDLFALVDLIKPKIVNESSCIKKNSCRSQSYNDVMILDLKNSLESKGLLVSNGRLLHVRRCAYIINLLVQSTLKLIESILEDINYEVGEIN